MSPSALSISTRFRTQARVLQRRLACAGCILGGQRAAFAQRWTPSSTAAATSGEVLPRFRSSAKPSAPPAWHCWPYTFHLQTYVALVQGSVMQRAVCKLPVPDRPVQTPLDALLGGCHRPEIPPARLLVQDKRMRVSRAGPGAGQVAEVHGASPRCAMPSVPREFGQPERGHRERRRAARRLAERGRPRHVGRATAAHAPGGHPRCQPAPGPIGVHLCQRGIAAHCDPGQEAAGDAAALLRRQGSPGSAARPRCPRLLRWGHIRAAAVRPPQRYWLVARLRAPKREHPLQGGCLRSQGIVVPRGRRGEPLTKLRIMTCAGAALCCVR